MRIEEGAVVPCLRIAAVGIRFVSTEPVTMTTSATSRVCCASAVLTAVARTPQAPDMAMRA